MTKTKLSTWYNRWWNECRYSAVIDAQVVSERLMPRTERIVLDDLWMGGHSIVWC